MIINKNSRKLIYNARELFYPAGCGHCGKYLCGGDEAFYGLCSECYLYLKAYMQLYKKCEICGRPLISEKATCLLCRKEDHKNNFTRQIRIFPYTGSFKNLLAFYKFEQSLGLGNFFAECLTESLNLFKNEEITHAEWVPVPPRPGKLKAKGWDQISYLASLLKRTKGALPVNPCLLRLKSRSQKELNRQDREFNLKGRIICKGKAPKSAIIFDDVITTGATMDSCAKALLEGGTEKVYGICLFYD